MMYSTRPSAQIPTANDYGYQTISPELAQLIMAMMKSPQMFAPMYAQAGGVESTDITTLPTTTVSIPKKVQTTTATGQDILYLLKKMMGAGEHGIQPTGVNRQIDTNQARDKADERTYY